MLLLLLVTNSYLGLDSIALCLSIHMYTAHCMYIVYILFFNSSEHTIMADKNAKLYLSSVNPIKIPNMVYDIHIHMTITSNYRKITIY